MPSARSASARQALSNVENQADSNATKPSAYVHLLECVNGMRKCCDMTKFYDTIASQGDDFIADSIQHANQVLANYASSSKLQRSPSKMAGEMLKTPSRRKGAARTRGPAAKLVLIEDPFSEDVNMADKENRPSQATSTAARSTAKGADKTPFMQRLFVAKEVGDKVKAIPDAEAKEETAKSALQELPNGKEPEKAEKAAAEQLPIDSEAATTPTTKTQEPNVAADKPSPAAVESQSTALAPEVPSTSTASVEDEAQSKKADAARNALLASKLMQTSEPAEKPVKRTLSSFGAKKSLPSSQHAAAVALPASTPAGPGFRSSFLNKSLRKRVEDAQAKEDNPGEDEEDERDSSDEATSKPSQPASGPSKLMEAMTVANTRANAAASSSAKPKPHGLKRKSEDDLDGAVIDLTSGKGSPPPAKMLKEASSRLASKAGAAAAAAKPKAASGPTSKLEMFRNNLATVTRNGGGVSLSSSSAFARQVSASSPAKALPVPPPPAAIPSSDPVPTKSSATKLYPKLPESNAERVAAAKAADAQAMAPPKSPGKVAPSSPVRLPPRGDSVRKSPSRFADRSRFGTPSKTTQAKENDEKRSNPTSPSLAARGLATPSNASRGLGMLFGSPSRLVARSAVGTTTPAASPGPKAVQNSKIKFPASYADSAPTRSSPSKAVIVVSDDEADSSYVDEKELGPAQMSPTRSQTQAPASQQAAESQPRSQNTQLSTQFFDASSRPPSQMAQDEDREADDDNASEGELTLEDLSGNGIGVEAPKSPEPVARPPSASPRKMMTISQPSRLNGSVRNVPPSAPNGKPLSQQQQLQKNASINKAPSSKLPTAASGAGSQQSAPSSSSTAPSSDASTPSGGWGISAKIKGLLGFQSAAQPQSQPQPALASTSQQARPRTMSISQITNAFQPQLNNSQSSAKPASLARAEMLRRKEAEEAERKAKEKEERRRMVMAAKEKRAKAALEEEQEKAKKKRVREETDRAKRDANDALPSLGTVKSKYAPMVVDAKKRKVSVAEQAQPMRPVAGPAPKMARTVSQSTVARPLQQPQPTQFKISTARPPPGAHVPGQPIRFGSSVAGPSTGVAAANAAKQQQVAAAVTRVSIQNPFQQARMQKPPPPPQSEDESHDEALPDVNSEYSDSEDEETIQRRATHPEWTQGESLHAALVAQATMDADEIFGIPQGPVRLEEILPSQHSLMRIRRPRSSSANWSGPDGLAQWEIDRYNHRLGIRGAGVLLQQERRASRAAERRASQTAPRRSNLPKQQPPPDEKKPHPPPHPPM